MRNPEQFVAQKVAELAATRGKAIIAASGGVDSSVAAVLTARAIGERLMAVFVDTGLLRAGEAERVRRELTGMGLNLCFVDASDEFLAALAGTADAEEKRKIIGERFIRVFERVARAERTEYLVQGTIAPDWIESGGGVRDKIKSHHNVGGLPADLGLKLIEPLRDLYKDEVRQLATSLGIPMARRQPFPGPGLAVRIMGEVTRDRVELVRTACAIVEEEIEKATAAGEMDIPWQYFAVLLPVKTVGVHGDLRRYGETVAVRAVASSDAMSAAYAKVPHSVLERISVRITNTLGSQVNRIVYDITHKPPGTIEWE